MLHMMLSAGIKGAKGICNIVSPYIVVEIGLNANVTHDNRWNQGY